jgi:hypothetical protein
MDQCKISYRGLHAGLSKNSNKFDFFESPNLQLALIIK